MEIILIITERSGSYTHALRVRNIHERSIIDVDVKNVERKIVIGKGSPPCAAMAVVIIKETTVCS